jgi:hypothetical protein
VPVHGDQGRQQVLGVDRHLRRYRWLGLEGTGQVGNLVFSTVVIPGRHGLHDLGVTADAAIDDVVMKQFIVATAEGIILGNAGEKRRVLDEVVNERQFRQAHGLAAVVARVVGVRFVKHDGFGFDHG